MRVSGLLILALFLLITISGCKASEATGLPEIKGEPYRTVPPQSKFSSFTSLPSITAEPDPDGIGFLGIGFGADGAYVNVQFTMSVNQTGLLKQDFIYVVDEETRVVYKDIPVMPIVGPLIGRPARDGQAGYVMLINYANGVKSGSVVSVVIGKYKREHVTVP